ncbi:MAG: ABC transporter ATP-binding protein [Pyrinomonadaceae bacterium]|nr:ABC transporter ATP-binding protein [Blastocatellia bacterium]MCW5957865.1 ABC transporter ATP-binding protein [Pyrinomonadaceae bacterium]
MTNIIEIENLSKEYETGFWKKKKTLALDGVSLEVGPGQIFGFLGGNGAGKTTTIKILMTLLFPTSGSAKILGRDISEVDMHRRIGYSPENPYFYDYLTPRELLAYFADLFGHDRSKSKAHIDGLLTKVGLDEKDWNKQLRKFSKGMLQRVSIAQSIINGPEVVFMDEPMSGLDPIGRREIRELIADLRSNGTTVFMSTHILSDVEALCDEVAILRKGKLAATGKLDELLVAEGRERTFEIIMKSISKNELENSLSGIAGMAIEEHPSGVTVKVIDENDVDKVLAAARKLGGRLISVNIVKQSLEELFVQETA